MPAPPTAPPTPAPDHPPLTATGYTRIYDELARELGLVAAAVYGRVWWYARGPLGRCVASQTRIGHDLGLDRKTVNRKLGLLIEAGYIQSLTGNRRYRPHELLVTDKLLIPAQLGGTARGTVSGTTHDTGRGATRPKPVTQPDPTVGQAGTPAETTRPMTSAAQSLKELNKEKRDLKNKEEEGNPALAGSRNSTATLNPDPYQAPPEAVESLPAALSFANMIYLKEIRHFYATTAHWPYPAQAELIVNCMQQHGLLAQDLRPYWHAWVGRGHNPRNLAWLLEWAAQGSIPQQGTRPKKKTTTPAAAADLDKYTTGKYAHFIQRG